MVATTQQVLSHLRGYPRTLTWADFRRVNQSLSPPYHAQTSSRYSWRYSTVRLVGGVYKLNGVQVQVRVDRNGSWVVSSWLQNASAQDKQDLLRHEQGHFDITGLIARDLCRDLLSLEMSEAVVGILRGVGNSAQARLRYAGTELRRQAQQAASGAESLHRRVENSTANNVTTPGLYETETNHGGNARVQQRWDRIFRFARTTDTSLWISLDLNGYHLPVR